MLNESTLRALYPRADENQLLAFAERNGELFERFAIAERPIRLHMFLAQIGHESAGLTVFSENLNYRAERIPAVWPRRFATVEAARPYAHDPEKLANAVYGGRMGNGPAASGDGWRFRGRGLIQITGRDAYGAVAGLIAVDLVNQPDLALRPEHALHVVCGVWAWKELNGLADQGDVIRVTRRINGGTVGLADRRAWLDKVRGVLGEPPGEIDRLETAEIVALQRALQARGYGEVGAADGVVGPRTMAAVLHARSDLGLPEGGIDRALRRALGIDVT